MAKIKLSIDRHGRPTATASIQTAKGLRPATVKGMLPAETAKQVGSDWGQLIKTLYALKDPPQDGAGKARTE